MYVYVWDKVSNFNVSNLLSIKWHQLQTLCNYVLLLVFKVAVKQLTHEINCFCKISYLEKYSGNKSHLILILSKTN